MVRLSHFLARHKQNSAEWTGEAKGPAWSLIWLQTNHSSPVNEAFPTERGEKVQALVRSLHASKTVLPTNASASHRRQLWALVSRVRQQRLGLTVCSGEKLDMALTQEPRGWITSDVGCLRLSHSGVFYCFKIRQNAGIESIGSNPLGGIYCWKGLGRMLVHLKLSLSISSVAATRVEAEGMEEVTSALWALVCNQWTPCTTCSINTFMGSVQHRWKHCISNSNLLKMVNAHKSLSNAPQSWRDPPCTVQWGLTWLHFGHRFWRNRASGHTRVMTGTEFSHTQ